MKKQIIFGLMILIGTTTFAQNTRVFTGKNSVNQQVEVRYTDVFYRSNQPTYKLDAVCDYGNERSLNEASLHYGRQAVDAIGKDRIARLFHEMEAGNDTYLVIMVQDCEDGGWSALRYWNLYGRIIFAIFRIIK